LIMPKESNKCQRTHPVHGVLHLADQPTIVFGTVCTKNRASWLASPQVHHELRDVWLEASAWVMGKYVIMPDHIHFFAAATESPIPFDNWVKYWKSLFTKRHHVLAHQWLSGHWDTRMRSAAHFEEKWDYVQQNPVRQGLVKAPGQWSLKGEIFEFCWD
jgi:putative transposase